MFGVDQLRQEKLYSFPYHYLAYRDLDIWRISRSIFWGYEYMAILETILELIKKKEPNTLLDFGCGDGRLLYELSQHHDLQRLVGVDISKRSLALARGMNTDSKGKLLVELYENPELVSGHFDVIVAMETLEHVPDEDVGTVLETLRSRLGDNGVFIVSVPTANRPRNPKHHRHYGIEDLENQVRNSFQVKEVLYVHHCGWRSEFMRRIVHNRFVTMEFRPLLRWTTWAYRRFALRARSANAAHLITVLESI